MESKLCRQQNAMVSLAKPKYKISMPDKQNTWSNLLNKKPATTDTTVKPYKKSSSNNKTSKRINKGVQCESPKTSPKSPDTKPYQSGNSLSIFNPIRTLQFLIKEIIELPNSKNTSVAKIAHEMQVVVERMVNECSDDVHYSKLNVPIANDNYMIPTKENDYSNLKFEYNPQENKYWLVLLGKISELETSYSQLSKNCTKTEEKLLNVTSERDKLLEKFNKSCDSLEKLNNREREYLDTISELKTKLMASEKLINKQETIIISLNQQLNNLPNKGKEFANGMTREECKSLLKENNNFKQNFNNDKLKTTNYFKDTEVSKLRSDIKQMKEIVLSGLENMDIKSISMTSLKSEGNQKGYKVNNTNVENDIDAQYNEYNRQASAIKQAKTELQQLFKTIKTQTNHSKKLFNSTAVDNERILSDISDDEDNHSNLTNFMSVVTDSSC